MSYASTAPGPDTGARPRILLAVVVLVGLFALLDLTGALGAVQSVIPGLNTPAASYQTATVSTGTVTVGVTATGPVSAATSVPLSFKESGKLATIAVGVGQPVTNGQTLATLDTSDLQVALTQAKATLAEAQANLASVKAGATPQTVTAAQVAVNNAKSTASDAQASVATTQATNTQNVQAAQASQATTQTNLKNATATLAAAQDQANQTIAADQAAITIDQKSLALEQATVAADLPVLEQQIEQAKNTLWSAQISHDAACGRGGGSSCDAANATVAADQTAVNAANASLAYSQKQSAQQVASAQATLDQAQLTLTKDQAAQNAAVLSAQNQVNQDQAALKQAQVAVGQAQATAAANAQSAQSQVTTAANSVQSAQAAFNTTVAPPTQTSIQTATAQVQNAQAAVDQAQANLDSATLTAPFTGTISAVNGSVGQWISGGSVAATSGSSASATAIFTEMDLTNLQVVAQVNEADISKVKVGDPVTFAVSAFPNQTFTGKVVTIQPVGTTSSSVVVYNVTSSIQSIANATLYPGMTATVTIVSAQRPNVLTVPATALSFARTAVAAGLVQAPAGASGAASAPAARSATRTAATASGAATSTAGGTPGTSSSGSVVTLDNGKLALVPVTTGLSDGSVTEVAAGLTAGQTVVTGQNPTTTASAATSSSSTASRASSPLTAGGPRG
jgi:HlyD family secretion protein